MLKETDKYAYLETLSNSQGNSEDEITTHITVYKPTHRYEKTRSNKKTVDHRSL